MEQLFDILLDKGVGYVILGVVIYFLFKEWKEVKTENIRLNQLLLDTLRDNNKEQREAEKEPTKAMNDVTNSLNSLTKVLGHE